MDALLEGLDRYTRPAPALHAFGARVFKVSQDEQGTRLTWLRVTGGELKVKALLSGEADGEPWAEKANQLRLYSGAKYTLTEAIGPGQVCAVTGLTHAKPGTGLGAERDSDVPVLEPVLSYQVLLPEGADVHAALGKLHRLEEEEPQLHVVWNETLGEIHVQLMGEVQLEVLRSLLAERFGLEVSFGPGGICIRRPSPSRWKVWDITSRCATMPRCICCWNRCPGAAGCSLPPIAGKRFWTKTGSVWC